MNYPQLDRAQQLIQFKRFAEAEKEIRSVLAQDPNHTGALGLLTICLAESDKSEEALKVIQHAVSVEPDNDYLLYLMSWIYYRLNKYKDAEKAIGNAIAFNPHQADYFGLLATVKINLKQWQEALDAANQGLAVDPENLQCLNVRSTALFKLDNKEAAFHTIQEALNHDPENDATHTNLGWGLLEKGDHNKALIHFREALRLNPDSRYAKAGLIEGLKARYWFYRIFLKYAFWIGNMNSTMRWVVLLGFFFGNNLLRSLSESHPALSPFIDPIVYLYVAFALSTWVITPLSNLFLRLNVYGRYALTREQILSSNFVGISLALGLVTLTLFFVTQSFLFLLITLIFMMMMIPFGSMFKTAKGVSKWIFMGSPIVLGLIGIAAIVQLLRGDVTVLGVFAVGILAYQFIANAAMMRSE